VYKEKSQGGLGVRNVRVVNLSLLTKWRWRLLQPDMPLWKEVIVARYGNHCTHHVDWSDRRIPASSSKWWRDICALDKAVISKNWLEDALVRRVGNGSSTFFAPQFGLMVLLFLLLSLGYSLSQIIRMEW
jgi:hypothetical protein